MIIKTCRERRVGHVASTRQMRMRTKFFNEKHKGKKVVDRPRRRWKDNIKMNLMEIELEDVDCG
jgi:hypothetical protein